MELQEITGLLLREVGDKAREKMLAPCRISGIAASGTATTLMIAPMQFGKRSGSGDRSAFADLNGQA